MPKSHEMQGPGAAAGSDDESGRLSRRTVLRGAAGAGAAGLAMSALAGAALAGPAMAATSDNSRKTSPAAHDEAHDVTDGEAVVVHVRDVRTGELDVYRGTSHVRMTDRELAARLARASK